MGSLCIFAQFLDKIVNKLTVDYVNNISYNRYRKTLSKKSLVASQSDKQLSKIQIILIKGGTHVNNIGNSPGPRKGPGGIML